MNPMDQSRRRRFQPSGGRGCLFLLGIVLITLAGCESGLGSRRQSSPDPFVGPVPSSPTPVPPPNTPSNAPTQTASTDSTPPLPSSHQAAGGPASVAAGETATPDPGRNLRINADPFAPTSASGNSAVRGVAPAVLGSPEPANNGSSSRLAPVPNATPSGQSIAAPTGVAAGAGLTFDQAQLLLKQYAVSWQRLDMDEGQWKFECGVPNPSNPAVNRHYQTTKGAPDAVSAIREVIAQIQKNPP